MWSWNPVSGNWAWLSGRSIGDQINQLSGPLKGPGARSDFSSTFDKNTAAFYVFGGYGFASSNRASLSDLWRYDIVENEWVYLSGNPTKNQGSYGAIGIFGATNAPGARRDHTMIAHPVSGLLVLFGGQGFGGEASGMSLCHKLRPLNVVLNLCM